VASDLSLAGEADKLVDRAPSVIFHLAAIVSGEAEADFEKGYASIWTARASSSRRSAKSAPATSARRVYLFDCRVRRAVSRGDRRRVPQRAVTSYGTQKAMGELLLSEKTRAPRLVRAR